MCARSNETRKNFYPNRCCRYGANGGFYTSSLLLDLNFGLSEHQHWSEKKIIRQHVVGRTSCIACCSSVAWRWHGDYLCFCMLVCVGMTSLNVDRSSYFHFEKRKKKRRFSSNRHFFPFCIAIRRVALVWRSCIWEYAIVTSGMKFPTPILHLRSEMYLVAYEISCIFPRTFYSTHFRSDYIFRAGRVEDVNASFFIYTGCFEPIGQAQIQIQKTENQSQSQVIH